MNDRKAPSYPPVGSVKPPPPQAPPRTAGKVVDLMSALKESMADADAQAKKRLTLDEIERRTILHRLDEFHGNMTATAASLGISRQTLWRKLQRYRAFDVRPA